MPPRAAEVFPPTATDPWDSFTYELRVQPLRATAIQAPGVVVAEGIALSADDFHLRFEGLPLDAYRERMSPALFAVLMRFSGLVRGRAETDVVRATDALE